MRTTLRLAAAAFFAVGAPLAPAASSTAYSPDITVDTRNFPPVANPQPISVSEDATKGITLTGIDFEGKPLTYSVVTKPAHGALAGSGAVRTYTPDPDYCGPDSFTFKVWDGALESAPATVSITVLPVNDAPVANPDFALTGAGGVTVPVLANDTDPDGDLLAVTGVTQGASGSVVFAGTSVTYTPGKMVETDSFTYTVSDGAGGTATGTVAVKARIPVEIDGSWAGPVGTGDGVTGEPPWMRCIRFGVPSVRQGGIKTFKAVLQAGMQTTDVILSGADGRVMVREGGAAPDGAGVPMADTSHAVTFAGFSDPLINDLGDTAFVASLAGTGVSAENDVGLWTDAFGPLAMVVRTGAPAPGLPGAVLKSIGSAVLSEAGGEGLLVFVGRLASGVSEKVTGLNAAALWAADAGGVELLLRAGNYISAGGQTLQVKRFDALGLVRGGAGHGRAAGGGGVVARVYFANGVEAVLRLGIGREPELVGIENGGLPGAPAGALASSFGPPNLSSDGAIGGRVRFLPGTGGVSKADAEAILLGGAGADYGLLLARQGDAAPGRSGESMVGVRFKAFGDPAISGQGRVAFVGTLAGTSVRFANDTGIWFGEPGDLRLIAREGDPAPGGKGIFWAFTSLALPDDAADDGPMGPVFVATLRGVGGLRSGLFAFDSLGQLNLVAIKGGTVDVGGSAKVIREIAVLQAVAGSPAQVRSYNGERTLIYRLTFTDGTQRIVTTVIP